MTLSFNEAERLARIILAKLAETIMIDDDLIPTITQGILLGLRRSNWKQLEREVGIPFRLRQTRRWNKSKRYLLLQDGMKCCVQCGAVKSISEFNGNEKRDDRLTVRCKTCLQINREYRRRHQLKRVLRIIRVEYGKKAV